MSKRFFDSMLEDMDYINYYRWCSNQSFSNFGVPVNMYPNQYDLFNRGCYFPPYTLVPNTSKKNREAYYLFKRNEDRNFFPNNFYFGNSHFKGSGQNFNRRFEDNRKFPRSANFDLLQRNNSRRQFSNWNSSTSGQQYTDNQDENWFMKRHRGFNRDNYIQPSTSRLDNRQSKFEYSDSVKKDEMILTGQLGFHRSSPSLTNDRTSNLDNSMKGFGKNSSNIQLAMNSTSIPSPKSTEYETWYSVDEQQQIINVLKDVNYRHERQLWCDMQSLKNDHMSLDNSTASSVDHNSSDYQYGSFSSDEDDGITVLVSPTDHPLNDVMDSEMHLSIGSEDLIEKSTSDYFEEFQNIFTTSPEKSIINTLVKECFKEQPSKTPIEETSFERIVSKKEMDSDNNEMGVEDASGHKSSKDSNDDESTANKATPTNTEAGKMACSDKIARLSPAKPLSRWSKSGTRTSAELLETPDGSEMPKCGPVMKVATESYAEATCVPLKKIQLFSPVIQMSQSFELKNGPPVTGTTKDISVAVLSGSSETPKSFVIPKFGSVIEMKQISMPTRLQIGSSDQIVLTDFHRRKIQKQKYDFDCKYKNAWDFKPYNPIFRPQNSFPVSHMGKSIRCVYDSAQPSVHSINDYKNLISNIKNNSNKNFNRVPMKHFPNYEPKGRDHGQVFEIPSEKSNVLPTKNSHVSSPRMSETRNMIQSDSCLLHSFGLPHSDYEKSSLSESHLQVKSSKDLDRLYKRISLEELFSSGEADKPFQSSNLLNIPPFQSDSKLGLSSSSFVSPTDHLKHILKIGIDDTEVPTTEKEVKFKFQVPFMKKVDNVRISTGCQTEAPDDRCWNKSVSETSHKVSEVPTKTTKTAVVESNDINKVPVNDNEKIDLKSDLKEVIEQNTDHSVEFQNENNIGEVEDGSSAKNSTEQPNGDLQKDEKAFNKKGSRKRGKANRNKSKGEAKNDAEISCCEKCRQNMDIMNFSENEMQFDVLKQKGDGTDTYSMKKLVQMKAFEESVKTLPGQDKEGEKDGVKVQANVVLLDLKKSKPIISGDIGIKIGPRGRKPKTRIIYKDVFKEFSNPKDFSLSPDAVTRTLSDREDRVYDNKILFGSKPFKVYPVKRISNTSLSFKNSRSDYGSLSRYKIPRPKKHFEKYFTTKGESSVNVQPIDAGIQSKSPQEFKYKHKDETLVSNYPSSLHSDQYPENCKDDQNIHTDSNNLSVSRHPKKVESAAMQNGFEMSIGEGQYGDNATLDAKSADEDLTPMSEFGTSLKSHLKPAFSRQNGSNENLTPIDSKESFSEVKEVFLHDANTSEKWSGLANPSETVKSKSEIALTG